MNKLQALGYAEKALDTLGTAGGSSILTSPFRLLKIVKDTAKGMKKRGAFGGGATARPRSFRRRTTTAPRLPSTGGSASASVSAESKPLSPAKFNKINTNAAKTGAKLPFNSPNELKKNKPLDIGGKMKEEKSKIGKQLGNPVNQNYEEKIKNIMGVK